MTINEMFQPQASTHASRLPGSAELTAIAMPAAVNALNAMEPAIEEYRERIAVSFKSGEAMENLVADLVDIPALSEQAGFLLELPEETVDSILKSQQSKRSRLRSKDSTLDNYKSLMAATIAEMVLRLICNKPKSYAMGASKHSIDFTPAELEALAEDQQALRRAIRNIQSKKSTYKHREDFSEADEYYQQILKVEQQLIDLRVSNEHIVEVDTTRNALVDLLSDVDIAHLRATESKDLLEAIKALIEPSVPEEATDEPGEAEEADEANEAE